MNEPTQPKIGFVLCHGWAMTPAFFNELAAQLAQHFPGAPCHFLNLGYFSAADISVPNLVNLEPDIRWVGIGHSYGLVRLLRLPIQWHYLVSIAGFTRFAVDAALPQALLARLQTKPAATLRQFYKLCDLPAEQHPSGALQTERLAADLRDLMVCDEHKALSAYRVLALASVNDAVVPPELTQQCFSDVEIFWHDHAGHALGAVAAPWCVQQIKRNL
jgi:pimeloyl-[acyl-carrier protein] methyl ester esterase